jgi:NAD(P)-dependent dehydrogenase (short-subunit alcohol dehydrogenase family)
MTFRLDGHRAAVVGGAGAIGSEICRAYAGAGAGVAVLDVDEDAARTLAASLEGDGHAGAAVDVTNPGSADQAAAWCGQVDSVVYCAGIAFTANVADTDWALYRRLIAVNLDGAFYTSGAFTRGMIAAGRPGSFVFLTSTAGLRGEAGASAYCASKFGLVGLMESLAAELTLAGIRANAIAPGNVDSPLLRSVAVAQAEREGSTPEEMLDRYAHAGAAQRLVSIPEVAAAVLWLASPLAAGVTGEVLRVDAGQMIG